MVNIADLSLTLSNLRHTFIDEIGKILNQFDYPIIGCKDYAEMTPSYRRPIVGMGDTSLWIDSIEDTDCGVVATTENGRKFNIEVLTTDELLCLLTNLNSVWGIK